MTELDEQAKEILRTLRIGDRLTLRNERGSFLVKEINHPVEQEPWVSAVQDNGAWRFIRVSRIEAVVPRRGV